MMIGESGTSHTGDKHYYYKCAGAKRKLGCKKKSVKKDFIERAAVILTVNRVLRDEDTTIPALKKQLADTERGIENMLWRVLRLAFADFTEFIFHILLKQCKAGL